MQRTSGIVSTPIIKIDTSVKKGKRIVISGMVASDKLYIDIRHCFRSPETGEYLPQKRGICLSKEDLTAVLTSLGLNPDDLDPRVKNFLGNNSVEHIPMLTL